MCGRTACALDPGSIRKACSYRDMKSGKYRKPDWKESKSGLDYRPSLNICPTDVTPVLVSASHLEKNESDRVLYPMVWGMIPPWHQGNYKSHGLSTNNCRLENLANSKLYSPALKNGRRCVVLCEGFYEWQTTKKDAGSKQPYYIYAPQANGVKVEDPKCWEAEWDEDSGWKGPQMLKMAGLFSCWSSPEGQQIYSYSIITMESSKTLSWLHHRMPAILRTEEEVANWLDHGHVPAAKAMELLKPVDELTWHPVGTAVNNSRNKVDECNKPIELGKPKPSTPSSRLMQNWLKKASTSTVKNEVKAEVKSEVKEEGSENEEQPDQKRVRRE